MERAAAAMSGPSDDDGQVRLARNRIHILTALLGALDRHSEVTQVVVESEDRAAAMSAISDLLGADKVQAHAVLDLQWRSMTRARRRELADDLAKTRQWLENRGDGSEP